MRLTECSTHAEGMATRLNRPVALGLAGVAALVLGVTLASGEGAASPTRIRPPSWVLHGSYSPKIDPAYFVAVVDNPYFPLEPGTGFHFRGFKAAARQTDDMIVTHETKLILGVKCTVVRDTVSQDGKPIERTFDWYAQDKQGNVWYMGEDSLELENGHFVRASDSWQAGVNGAKPGIIMRARPHAGQVYRQEYYPPGGALDQARVIGRGGRAEVPYGTFKQSLVTLEWSPVEPQFERKVYVAGIGEVRESVTEGGHEAFELVRVTHG
jgi:hypothetical protein